MQKIYHNLQCIIKSLWVNDEFNNLDQGQLTVKVSSNQMLHRFEEPILG